MEQVTTKQVRASWLRSSIGTVWEVVFKIYKNSVDLFLPLQYMYMQMYLYMERKIRQSGTEVAEKLQGVLQPETIIIIMFWQICEA